MKYCATHINKQLSFITQEKGDLCSRCFSEIMCSFIKLCPVCSSKYKECLVCGVSVVPSDQAGNEVD